MFKNKYHIGFLLILAVMMSGCASLSDVASSKKPLYRVTLTNGTVLFGYWETRYTITHSSVCRWAQQLITADNGHLGAGNIKTIPLNSIQKLYFMRMPSYTFIITTINGKHYRVADMIYAYNLVKHNMNEVSCDKIAFEVVKAVPPQSGIISIDWFDNLASFRRTSLAEAKNEIPGLKATYKARAKASARYYAKLNNAIQAKSAIVAAKDYQAELKRLHLEDTRKLQYQGDVEKNQEKQNHNTMRREKNAKFTTEKLVSAIASGHGLTYILNYKAEITVPPDFSKILEKIYSNYVKKEKNNKITGAQRVTASQIELTTLVVRKTQDSNMTLLGKFKTQCILTPTLLFKAKQMGIFTNAYKFIKTHDHVQYKWFLLCGHGEHDAQWQRALKFPSYGFNLNRVKNKHLQFWYYIDKSGAVAFYF